MMNRPENLPNRLSELLQVSPPFDAFKDELKYELIEIATAITFEEGQTILNQDEPSPGMFLIESGAVKVSRLNHNGREYILTVLTRGRTFNDVTVLDQGTNPASVTAQNDCRVWCFPCNGMLDIASRSPTLALTLAANIGQETRYLVRELDGLSLCSVKARLARFLLNQSGTCNQLKVQLTQEEMANHLGTVREMVSRNLGKLKKEGVIQVHSEEITILDRNQLVAAAEL